MKTKTINQEVGISIKLIILSSLMIMQSCGNTDEQYDATGTFEATEIIVSAESSGKIMQFDVQEGLVLQPQQYVGFIDSVQLYLKKQQLLANIKSIQSRRPEVNKQIAVTQQQIATTKTERQRVENLVKANAANTKQLDDINAQIILLEKQLEAQKSTLDITNQGITQDVSALDIQIAQIDDQLQKCRITSPIGGTVLVKYAEAGELAMTGKALFKIAEIENMILRAYVTSGQLAQLKIGQEVKLYADYGEETREFTGKLTWISDKSEFTPKNIQTKDERENLVYAIKIAVKNDGYIKIGMYGGIKL